MSEPQHPQPQDTDANEGHPAPVARAVVQPVVQPGLASLDSLAAVGARLTQLRESKGWTIEDVSARLKVSVTKLRALESGDISHLPDTTFALGVVRSRSHAVHPGFASREGRARAGSVDAGFVRQGFAARPRIAVARRQRAKKPLVAMGHCGGDRRGDRARHVAYQWR
jgi:hypothetical protein